MDPQVMNAPEVKGQPLDDAQLLYGQLESDGELLLAVQRASGVDCIVLDAASVLRLVALFKQAQMGDAQ